LIGDWIVRHESIIDESEPERDDAPRRATTRAKFRFFKTQNTKIKTLSLVGTANALKHNSDSRVSKSRRVSTSGGVENCSITLQSMRSGGASARYCANNCEQADAERHKAPTIDYHQKKFT
jgi:hypothetical protein